MSILDKASLIQIPSGYKSTKLYSLRPSNGDGDFTFARSSSATRVNSEGLIETASVLGSELVTNGDFSSGGANWVVSNSDATHYVEFSEDGARFVSDTTSPILNLGQGISLTSGNKYRFSIRLRNNGGTGNIKIDASGLGFVPNILDGTYTQDIVLTTNQSVVSFYRNGADVDLYIEDFSIKEVFENDVPRLDYSGGASCASLLLEPQRTNLITYSEDFTQWNNNSSTVTPNQITSPDNNTKGSLIQSTGVSSCYIEPLNFSLTIGVTYTYSLFVKKGNNRWIRLAHISSSATGCWFDLDNGELGTVNSESATIDEYANGWYRITNTFVATSSSTHNSVFIGISDNDGSTNAGAIGQNVYIYGAQVEQGSYPTSYIISNSGSTTTRSADVCNNAGTSATFNDSEGVLFAEIAALADDGTNRRISISNGTTSDNDRINLMYTATSNQVVINYKASGTTRVSFDTTLNDITNFNKVAMLFKSGDFKFYVNGYLIDTDNNTNMIANGTLNELAFEDATNSNNFYGKTKQLMVFDEALSDEELSDLTGQVNLSFNNLATFYNYTIL